MSSAGGRLLRAGMFVAVAWHTASLASLWLGFLNPLFNDATQRLGQGADFFSVYQAGANIAHDKMVYQTAGIHAAVPYFYPFRYLPSAAFSIGLISNVVPPWTAYWSWVVFNE